MSHGVPIRLQRGRHFEPPVSEMRKQLLREARRRGAVVRTTSQRGGYLKAQVMHRRSHPWDWWLDGSQRELVPGVDFDHDIEVMREQARRAAKVRGLRIRSKVWCGSLWIQALPDTNTLESPTVG